MHKNLVLVLSGALLMAACGNNTGDTKPAENKDTATTAAPAATPVSDKGLELIGASAIAIHAATASTKAPAHPSAPLMKTSPPTYSSRSRGTTGQIPASIKSIMTGGSGIWGTTPMTPHPALKEDDVHTMVTYILSLKK